jgi:hypothetical protein
LLESYLLQSFGGTIHAVPCRHISVGREDVSVLFEPQANVFFLLHNVDDAAVVADPL